MEDKDIRWQQRLSNYSKALLKLTEAINKLALDDLSELEKEGLIQRFEYTYELAWNTLQDLLRDKGYIGISGPNAVLAQALQDGYIKDAKGWQKMKKARELTSHTYNSKTAEDIAQGIATSYYYLLKELETMLDIERTSHQKTLFDE